MEPTLFMRIAVVCGIMVGIASAAAVSLVVGGLAARHWDMSYQRRRQCGRLRQKHRSAELKSRLHR